jgi:hypothetical protein
MPVECTTVHRRYELLGVDGRLLPARRSDD